MNPFLAKLIWPGGLGSKIKGLDKTSASSNQLQAEGGADEAQPTRHHEGFVLYALVLANMHSLSIYLPLAESLCFCKSLYRRRSGLSCKGKLFNSMEDEDPVEDQLFTCLTDYSLYFLFFFFF